MHYLYSYQCMVCSGLQWKGSFIYFIVNLSVSLTLHVSRVLYETQTIGL